MLEAFTGETGLALDDGGPQEYFTDNWVHDSGFEGHELNVTTDEDDDGWSLEGFDEEEEIAAANEVGAGGKTFWMRRIFVDILFTSSMRSLPMLSLMCMNQNNVSCGHCPADRAQENETAAAVGCGCGRAQSSRSGSVCIAAAARAEAGTGRRCR